MKNVELFSVKEMALFSVKAVRGCPEMSQTISKCEQGNWFQAI